MSASGGGLPVGALVRFAQRKMKTGSSAQFQDQAFKIDYPENSGLGVLDETEIQDFIFIVGKGEESGKYGIDEFSISASSDLHLEIWHDKKLRLERVTLQAGYEAQVGFNFNFGSEFYIDEHIILATMGYGRLLSRGFFGDVSTTGHQALGGAENGWLIKAKYGDNIDLLAIARRLMGMELADSINDTKMEKLETDKSKGVVISNLVVALQHANSGGSIYISADTEWAVFKHVELAATYSAGISLWGFCLHMALRDDLLSLIPVECLQKFREWIKLNDVAVALYFGKVNTAKACSASR